MTPASSVGASQLSTKMPTLEDLIALAIDTFGHDPTDFQKEMWTEILDGHNVLGLGKTGCGKSLVFQLLGLRWTILVLSPLKSLMIEQVAPGQGYLMD